MEKIYDIIDIISDVTAVAPCDIISSLNHQASRSRHILYYVVKKQYPDKRGALATVLNINEECCRSNQYIAAKKYAQFQSFRDACDAVIKRLNTGVSAKKKNGLFVTGAYAMGFRFSELDLIGIQRAKRESMQFFEKYGKGRNPVVNGLYYQH